MDDSKRLPHIEEDAQEKWANPCYRTPTRGQAASEEQSRRSSLSEKQKGEQPDREPTFKWDSQGTMSFGEDEPVSGLQYNENGDPIVDDADDEERSKKDEDEDKDGVNPFGAE